MTTTQHPPREKSSSFKLSAMATFMAQVAELETTGLGFPEDIRFLEYAALVRLGLFRMVVMGEIKKGKSTFINALCGIRNLVPENTEVATSTIFKIRYGPKLRYVVFFLQKEGEELRTKEISADQLEEYGTEVGNPGNLKNVDFIAVEAPSAVLSSGPVIVDTPGVGGVIKEHRGITFKYAPKADAIFFIVDSVESPIGGAEQEFLLELRGITKKICFVQTKSDLVDTAVAAARMRNNLSILEKAGFDRKEIDYFVVSSTLKLDGDETRELELLQVSGFVPLARFFEVRMKAELDRHIGAVALERCGGKLARMASETVYRRKVLEADTKEKRAALTAEIEAISAKVHEWRTVRLPAEKLVFNTGLQETLMATQRSLRNALRPNGTLSVQVADRLRALDTASAVFSQAPEYLTALETTASNRLLTTCQQLVADLEHLIGELVNKVNREVLELLDSEPSANSIKHGKVGPLAGSGKRLGQIMSSRADDYRSASNALDRAGIALRNFGVAGAVSGTALGVAGLFFPVLLPFIPAAVAAISGSGAYIGDKGRNRREVQAARAEVQRAVDGELMNLYEQAADEITRISGKLSLQAAEALDTFFKAVSRQLDQRRARVLAREIETGARLKASREVQEALEATVAQLNREAETLAGQLD